MMPSLPLYAIYLPHEIQIRRRQSQLLWADKHIRKEMHPERRANRHYRELDVKVSYLHDHVIPVVDFNRVFAVGNEDHFPRPRLFALEVAILGLDANDQGVKCCGTDECGVE